MLINLSSACDVTLFILQKSFTVAYFPLESVNFDAPFRQ